MLFKPFKVFFFFVRGFGSELLMTLPLAVSGVSCLVLYGNYGLIIFNSSECATHVDHVFLWAC